MSINEFLGAPAYGGQSISRGFSPNKGMEYIASYDGYRKEQSWRSQYSILRLRSK